MAAFFRGPCLCGAAVCGPKCDCNCHNYDAYDCASILAAVKYFYPRVSVAELAGENRNELFRWIQKNVKALHEHMPNYLAESGLADDEMEEDEYLSVPLDISERMGEFELNGRNVPEGKLSAKRKAADRKPAEATGLCDVFGLRPKMVIRRLEPPRKKKRKCGRRG